MDYCPRCKQHLRSAVVAQALADALDQIVYVLREAQPEPRSASVSYVAGYARAMDDMERVIQEAARVATAVATDPRHAAPLPATPRPLTGADRRTTSPGDAPCGDF